MSELFYNQNIGNVITIGGILGLLLAGLICGFGLAGGFVVNPCNGEIHRECIQQETGNDLVYLITFADNHKDCYLGVDLNNIVGWKCRGYFYAETYKGFNLIIDGNWKRFVEESK